MPVYINGRLQGGGGGGAGALVGLDWQESVISRQTTPPGGPTAGDRYLVRPVGTGAWTGHDDEIAEWNGTSWVFTVPDEGFALWVEDQDLVYVYTGTAWVSRIPAIRQTTLDDITVDTTTTAASFPGSTLLTRAITIQEGSVLLIAFSVAASNTVKDAGMFFRLVVDGVVRRAIGITTPAVGAAAAGTIAYRVAGLAAGARTVEIQWYTNSGGTAQIQPVTSPDQEHASMVIQEVAV